ncbi:hypothetical protein D3C87_352680 [compost metagenome]
MKNSYEISILIGTLFSITGLIMIFSPYQFSEALQFSKPGTIYLIGVILLLYGIAFLLFSYLQSRRKRGITIRNLDIDSNISGENNELITATSEKETSNNYEENINTIKDQTIKYTYPRTNNRSYKIAQIQSINDRIETEIERLRTSANINLAFGSITTVSAIVFIGYEVINNPVSFNELFPLISHFLPRLGLVLLIEIFAFFFLKMYKATLQEMKYFQNEKTNIDLKLIALKRGLKLGDETINNLVLTELIKTERNFILKKDESTVDLQRGLIETKATNKTLEIVSNIFAKK